MRVTLLEVSTRPIAPWAGTAGRLRILLLALQVFGRPAGATAVTFDGTWLGLPPPVRQGHAAVYDSLRDRMIVIGGASTNPGMGDVWAYSLGQASWTRLIATGGPGPRVYATAVLDRQGDRIIFFGGRWNSVQGPEFNDVWALSLSGTPSWDRPSPAGTLPPARSLHAAVFDPGGNRMIIFGGSNGLNDVWQLTLGQTPTWTEITPVGGPGPRLWASAVFDPVRRRMVIFGGQSTGGGLFNDVWSLSLTDSPRWTRNFAYGTPPAPRSGHSAIYDPLTDSMILFGGNGPNGSLTDVWQFPLSGTPVWSQLGTTGTPPSGRAFASAIHDAARSHMVVFGGGNQASGSSDLLALTLSPPNAWTPLPPQFVVPSPRSGHTAVIDPRGDRMIMFGGGILTGTLWQRSLADEPGWSPVVTQGPAPTARVNHAAVYDPVRYRMLVFGGTAASPLTPGLFNDLWSLGLDGPPSWLSISTSGTPPSARWGHIMVYDPLRDRLLVFAGTDNSGAKNDVWSLPLDGPSALQWNPITPPGYLPAARYESDGVYDPVRDRLVIYGGTNGSTVYDDVWALTLGGNPTWELLMPTGSPAPNARQAAVYDPLRDRLVVLGSSPAAGWDVRALSLAGTGDWAILSPGGTRGYATSNGSAVYDPTRDRVLTFGGSTDNTAWALSWSEPLEYWIHGPGDITWTSGTVNTIPYYVYNPESFPQSANFRVTCDRNWPGLPQTGVVFLAPRDSALISVGVPVPDTVANGVVALDLSVAFTTIPRILTHELHLHNPSPTAAGVSLVRADAQPSLVKLSWYSTNVAMVAHAERRESAEEWRDLGRVAPDGSGLIVVEDRSVSPGHRYEYRLAVSDGSAVTYVGGVVVDVPVVSPFRLRLARANPGSGPLTVAVSISGAASARLELMDVGGRSRQSLALDPQGPLSRTLELATEKPLPAGIYFVRLTQGGRAATARVVMLP